MATADCQSSSLLDNMRSILRLMVLLPLVYMITALESVDLPASVLFFNPSVQLRHV